MRHPLKQMLICCALSLALVLGGCADPLTKLGVALGEQWRTDGRESGQSFSCGQSETSQNTFFNYRINSARLLAEVDGYLPDDAAHAFLVVNVTVTNTFKDSADIVMAADDFELSWDALGDQTVFPESSFSEKQLPDTWKMFQDETKSGDFIYLVPAHITDYELIYVEIYEDDFQGNHYSIAFEADTSDYDPDLANAAPIPPSAEDSPIPPDLSSSSQPEQQEVYGSGSTPLANSFFNFQVNRCRFENKVNSYVPSIPGEQFLIVNVTIHNIFGEELPMYASDFQVRWGDDELETIFAEDQFSNDQLGTTWMMQADESITGDLIFMVPSGPFLYELVYEEFYNDGTSGDLYVIPLSPSGTAI